MSTLVSAMPMLVDEINAALVRRSRSDLVKQLEFATIERCTYYAGDDAGYVYLVRPAPSAHFAKLASVAETIPFLEQGFNVDVDHDGNLFGIEFLGRIDFLNNLRKVGKL